MTRRRRTAKEAHQVKMELAEIIKDIFDHNGQIITHEQLAREHVSRHASLTAFEDVQVYGGPAVVHLRNEENYAIVPVTASAEAFDGNPADEVEVANAVAGLGAGGARIGWYHPANKDDWLWIYYVGHLGRAGVHAVFHAAQQIDKNPQLISTKGRGLIAGQAVAGLPIPPGKTETKVLAARLGE
jgi:hypothetical protein